MDCDFKVLVASEEHFRSLMGTRNVVLNIMCPSGAEYDLPVEKKAAVRLYKHYRNAGKGVRVGISRTGALVVFGAA